MEEFNLADQQKKAMDMKEAILDAAEEISDTELLEMFKELKEWIWESNTQQAVGEEYGYWYENNITQLDRLESWKAQYSRDQEKLAIAQKIEIYVRRVLSYRDLDGHLYLLGADIKQLENIAYSHDEDGNLIAVKVNAIKAPTKKSPYAVLSRSSSTMQFIAKLDTKVAGVAMNLFAVEAESI